MTAAQRLAKLQLDRDALDAQVRGLSDMYSDLRANKGTTLLQLSHSSNRELALHWRWGDPVEFITELPAEKQAALAGEIALAKRVQDITAQMAAVQARLAPLQADLAALRTLVTNCEAYLGN